MAMRLFLIAALLLILLTEPSECVLRFANYYHNHMVLQMAPNRAQIWGYATTVGDVVHITLNGTHVADANVTQRHDGHQGGQWSALLPTQSAGGPYTVDIRSKDGHANITDVLFGDVWICSGQSNMVFTMHNIFNHSQELQNSAHFNNIRIMHLALRTSNHTVQEPAISGQWQKPANDKQTNAFSAVCLLYGMELSPHINRPIGLVETAWGGTPVEAWSSPSALSSCSHIQKSIHPRDKQDVAMRLALAGRAVAYGESNLDYQGPIPDDYTLMGNKLVIEFDQGNSAIEVRSTSGFEVCCGHGHNDTCGANTWTPAPIVEHDQSTVSINVTGCHGLRSHVTGVRYAWEMSPCDFKMCAIYDRNNDLPAAPFVKFGPFKTS